MIQPNEVTGIVLAGGLGRRMSDDGRGIDKGLQPFCQRPMIAHVLDRFAPQVGTVLVNANRNLERYRAFGWPLAPDAIEGFVGPLAGLHAGMSQAATAWVATVPCDSPFLPLDLVERLAGAIDASAAHGERAQLAVARTGTQAHPVFTLVDCALLPDLQRFLSEGRRKIDAWYAPLRVVEVEFDDASAFRNLNTLQELKDEERA